MQNTPNYGLKKPEQSDFYNVDDFNANADIIDTELKRVEGELANSNTEIANINADISDLETNKLDKTGDASNVTNTFTQASTRANLVSGEKQSTTFGKLMKWFADLKPVAWSGNASDLTEDASNRLVTDAEKNTWNAKASTAPVTTTANGLMISTDKSKLDGVATGANNYTHPSTHSPSIIAQDASNRFVTDSEKSAWGGKANAVHSHAISDVTNLQTSLDTLTSKDTEQDDRLAVLEASGGKQHKVHRIPMGQTGWYRIAECTTFPTDTTLQGTFTVTGSNTTGTIQALDTVTVQVSAASEAIRFFVPYNDMYSGTLLEMRAHMDKGPNGEPMDTYFEVYVDPWFEDADIHVELLEGSDFKLLDMAAMVGADPGAGVNQQARLAGCTYIGGQFMSSGGWTCEDLADPISKRFSIYMTSAGLVLNCDSGSNTVDLSPSQVGGVRAIYGSAWRTMYAQAFTISSLYSEAEMINLQSLVPNELIDVNTQKCVNEEGEAVDTPIIEVSLFEYCNHLNQKLNEQNVMLESMQEEINNIKGTS